jgi:hypothetical protein
MKPIHQFATFVLTTCMLFSCGTSKHEKMEDDQKQMDKEQGPMIVGESIPPNNCRVIGTIVSIDPTLSGGGEKDPCSKAPCQATVRIDSLMGYGSAFPMVLSAGQQLRVKFGFTLGPTRELMPEVKPAMPGLSVGSRFQALINGSVAMGKTEPVYTIYGYERQ